MISRSSFLPLKELVEALPDKKLASRVLGDVVVSKLDVRESHPLLNEVRMYGGVHSQGLLKTT